MAKYSIPISVETTDSGKRYYSSGLLEGYTPSDADFTYVTRPLDRWDLLANRFYRNPQFWYVLVRANGGADGSMFIRPGRTIIIPQII